MRQPIAGYVIADRFIYVVCSDGAVFVTEPGDKGWVEQSPIPGTRAELRKGREPTELTLPERQPDRDATRRDVERSR